MKIKNKLKITALMALGMNCLPQTMNTCHADPTNELTDQQRKTLHEVLSEAYESGCRANRSSFLSRLDEAVSAANEVKHRRGQCVRDIGYLRNSTQSQDWRGRPTFYYDGRNENGRRIRVHGVEILANGDCAWSTPDQQAQDTVGFDDTGAVPNIDYFRERGEVSLNADQACALAGALVPSTDPSHCSVSFGGIHSYSIPKASLAVDGHGHLSLYLYKNSSTRDGDFLVNEVRVNLNNGQGNSRNLALDQYQSPTAQRLPARTFSVQNHAALDLMRTDLQSSLSQTSACNWDNTRSASTEMHVPARATPLAAPAVTEPMTAGTVQTRASQ